MAWSTYMLWCCTLTRAPTKMPSPAVRQVERSKDSYLNETVTMFAVGRKWVPQGPPLLLAALFTSSHAAGK